MFAERAIESEPCGPFIYNEVKDLMSKNSIPYQEREERFHSPIMKGLPW